MAMQKDMMSRAVRDSFAKLDPRVQVQNPVMSSCGCRPP